MSKTLLTINREGFGGTKINTVNPYTVMETTVYKVVTKALEGVTIAAPVEPFRTCFASKDIEFSVTGPSVPSIDLVLHNERIVCKIMGENSMAQVNNDVICLGLGLDK